MKGSIRAPETQTALRIYHTHRNAIGSEQIRELFGVKSSSTIARIKKEVRQKQIEEGIKVWDPRTIDTDTAFEVWGLDVKELEKSYKKMTALGIERGGEG